MQWLGENENPQKVCTECKELGFCLEVEKKKFNKKKNNRFGRKLSNESQPKQKMKEDEKKNKAFIVTVRVREILLLFLFKYVWIA